MVRKFNSELELKKYLLQECEFFSPSHLSRDFEINQSIAVNICRELQEENKFIEKYYEYDCPKCGGSTGSGGKEKYEDDVHIFCESCDHTGDAHDFDLTYYYKNNQKKKASDLKINKHLRVEKTNTISNYKTNDEETSKIGLELTELELLSIEENIIWHISDMHFGPEPLYRAPNHCETRKSNFLNILRRRSNIENDIILITGDLTTNGSEASFKIFEDFYTELLKLKIKEENILIIPGNHDAWQGVSQIRAIYKLIEDYVLVPRKVKNWPLFLKHLEKVKMHNVVKHLNNTSLSINLTDTTAFQNLSLGFFPRNFVDENDCDIKILVIHHHVMCIKRDWWSGPKIDIKGKKINTNGKWFKIPILHKISCLWKVFKHSIYHNAMTVANEKELLKWIEDNKINIVIHGHRHVSYYNQCLETNEKVSSILAAPSLSEAGFQHENSIGFNCIVPRKNNFDVYLITEKDSKLKVNQFFSKQKVS